MYSQEELISRRRFLYGSAGAAGLLVMPHAAGSWAPANASDSPEEYAQKAYIEAVLVKHTGCSRRLNKRQVRTFADRFTQVYGVVDYRGMYGGIAGEYRLTRLFVRSAKLAVSASRKGVLA